MTPPPDPFGGLTVGQVVMFTRPDGSGRTSATPAIVVSLVDYNRPSMGPTACLVAFDCEGATPHHHVDLAWLEPLPRPAAG